MMQYVARVHTDEIYTAGTNRCNKNYDDFQAFHMLSKSVDR